MLGAGYFWKVFVDFVGTFEQQWYVESDVSAARRSTRWCTPKMAGCTPKMAGCTPKMAGFMIQFDEDVETMGFSTISSDPFSKVLLQVGIYLEHQNHLKHWIGKNLEMLTPPQI